jgi:HD-like signal output (HDOD) protein/DNA-binding NarL/FixJ family response regulator
MSVRNSRFLVVDDDPVSLQKLKIILSELGECETATSGNEAVGYFVRNFNANTPFDLVALDIGLPDVKGTDVLVRLRQFEQSFAGKGKRAKIIMITSHSDRESVQKSLKNGCNGYLVKPFNEDRIYNKLAELGWVAGLEVMDDQDDHTDISSEPAPKTKPEASTPAAQTARPAEASLKNTIIGKIKEIKGGQFTLPGQPDLYLKLKTLVDAGADLATVSDLLKNHSALTGSVIRISNTSRYRGVVPNKSLSEAIGRLGLRETMEQVCAISTKEMCTSMPAKYQTYSTAVWRNSLACAFTCENIASILHPKINVDPFTLGLMHDVGKMAMLRIFEHIETKKIYTGEVSWPAMTPIINQYEGLLGSMLLQQWSLPDEYQKVARYHGGALPDNRRSEELLMANLAIDVVSDLEKLADTDNATEAILALVKKHSANYPSLSGDTLIEIVSNVSSSLAESVKAIG